jgi:hypothetical protein
MKQSACCLASGFWGTALALFLIGAGALLLLDRFGIVWLGRLWDLWPLSLIAVGVAVVLDWRKKRMMTASETETGK